MNTETPLFDYRYQLLEKIGEGSSGVVYAAFDTQMQRTIALKKLLTTRLSERFQREFAILTRLDHPNILKVYDFGKVDETNYFTMEYEKAITLDIDGFINQVDAVKDTAVQICQGLAVVHQRRIVHGDIKPENILRNKDNILKIMDFSLSVDIDLTHETRSLTGTLAYLAPESIRGFRNDPRSDLYALGIMLYRLISGKFPVSTDNALACIQDHYHHTPVRLDIPMDLWRVIERLLRKNPTERYQTAEEVLIDITSSSVSEGNLFRGFLCETSEFINRQAEINQLMKSISTPSGEVLEITGEGGIGKTRLLREVKFQAQLQEISVITIEPARPSRQRSQMEWQAGEASAIQSLLITLLSRIPFEDHEYLPYLVKILPNYPNFFHPNKDDETSIPEELAVVSDVMFHQKIAELIAKMLQHQQILLLADDVDLWDQTSQAIFERLCKQTPIPIFYTSHRQLIHLTPHQTIKLTGLTEEQLLHLIKSLLGRVGNIEILLESVLKESQGNPAAAEEWIRTLIQQDILFYQAGTWSLTQDTLKQFQQKMDTGALLQLRFSQLSESNRQVLIWLAVAHHPLPANVLVRLMETPLNTIYNILTDLLQDNWIIESQAGYQIGRIEHQRRLYDQIDPSRHQQLAMILEELHPHRWDDFVFHFEAAKMNSKAGEYAIKVAKEYTRRGLYSLAISYNQKALELLQDSTDFETQFYLQMETARMYRQLGKLEQAIQMYHQMQQLAIQQKEEKRIADTTSDIGSVHVEQRNYETALQCFDDAFHRYRQLADQPGMIAALANMGGVKLENYQYPQAIEYYQNALEQATMINHARLQAVTALNLGSVYYRMGRFAEALENYQKTREIAAAKNRPAWVTLADLHRGWVYVALGQFTEAKTLLQPAEKDFRQGDDIQNWTEALIQLAEITFFEGEYQQAEEYLAQITTISEAKEMIGNYIRGLIWSGMIELEQLNWTSALEKLQLARQLAQKHHLRKEETIAMILCWQKESPQNIIYEIEDLELHLLWFWRLSQAAFQQKDWSTMKTSLDKAETVLSRFPHAYWQAEIEFLTGQYHWVVGEYETANHHFNEAIHRYRQMGNHHKADWVEKWQGGCSTLQQPLLDMIAAMNQTMALEPLLELIVDTVISVADAERGFIMLADQYGTLRFQTARGLNRETLEGEHFAISRSMVRQVYETGKALFINDILSSEEFEVTGSIVDLDLRSIICIPLHRFRIADNVSETERPIGVLYLDTRFETHQLSTNKLSILKALARQAAIAIENVRLNQQLYSKIDLLSQQVSERFQFEKIIGKSKTMQRIYAQLEIISQQDVTVLITGETGTGKELVAQAIHYNSKRASAPFVAINCAALPEELLESELFGHERGSFTGAIATKQGKLEAANGGTLFLDEIGDMPLGIQAKVLRVIQERTFQRIGSNKDITIDIRIIAATHHDLLQLAIEKKFREDLYYRLNVVPLHLPALRERQEDIPLLVKHFVDRFNQKLGKKVENITDSALQKLIQYEWQGNVRQLENIIERMLIFTDKTILTEADLPKEFDEFREFHEFDEFREFEENIVKQVVEQYQRHLQQFIADSPPKHESEKWKDIQTYEAFKQHKTEMIGKLEKQFILNLLEHHQGNIQQAAAAAGVRRTQFYAMMNRHQIDWQKFRS